MTNIAPTIDLKAIGWSAYRQRGSLRDLPVSLVNALKLAREMIMELDYDHDEGRPSWCTRVALDAVLACAMGSAIHLETLAREIAQDDDADLPMSIQ